MDLGGLFPSERAAAAFAPPAVVHEGGPDLHMVLLTTDLPVCPSAGNLALELLTGPDRSVFNVAELLGEDGRSRLSASARGLEVR